MQFLVPERHIVPGEVVDLTGDIGHSAGDADDGDKYESSSSAKEEEFQEDESQTLSTLSEEANFLPGSVSRFGRAVTGYVLMKYWNKKTQPVHTQHTYAKRKSGIP